MLEKNYQRRLGRLISKTPGAIEMPECLNRFFEESGPIPSCENERRHESRTRVRTRGILIPESWLPAFPRHRQPALIYTRDFSRTGFGCLSHEQYFPGETVRVLLATFWMQIEIRRCRRLGASRFELGAALLHQHAPSDEAFVVDGSAGMKYSGKPANVPT